MRATSPVCSTKCMSPKSYMWTHISALLEQLSIKPRNPRIGCWTHNLWFSDNSNHLRNGVSELRYTNEFLCFPFPASPSAHVPGKIGQTSWFTQNLWPLFIWRNVKKLPQASKIRYYKQNMIQLICVIYVQVNHENRLSQKKKFSF